jgi:hypothetical protein
LDELETIFIRLHFWPNYLPGYDTDIHSHCADFTSKIISGSLLSAEYENEDHGASFFEHEYLFDSTAKHSYSTIRGKTNLRMINKIKLDKGCIYSQSFDKLHQTLEVSAGTLTLSIWGKRDHSARVLRKNKAHDDSSAVRAGLDVGIVKKYLQYIADMIEREL